MKRESKIWIMPIAGNGTRTKELGEFKPFIEVNNKKIIEWFMLSILDKINKYDKFVFITTAYFNKKFNVTEILQLLFKKFNLNNPLKIILSEVTPQGPARSVELSLNNIEINTSIIVINVDQFLLFKLPEKLENKCYLVVNIDTGSSKSYIEVNNKKIVRIEEKINNSNIASAGVYIFPNKQFLENSLNYIFKNNIMHKEEFYIATAMNYLINKIDFELIPTIAKFDLGTVENIDYFKYISYLLCNKMGTK